ncbi:MAG: AAA family ATPase, partial [Actinomycetota bacterium]|nr:AAA family ATPase [Actinomycetota bacterium]
MKTIVVTSTRPYTGKSGIALTLIGILADRGLDVGYFKPYGTMPVHAGGLLTDEDALYINRSLKRPSELADVCPVVRSQSFVEDV